MASVASSDISLKQRVAMMPIEQRRAFVDTLSATTLEEILRDEWWWTSRPAQVPPPGAWLIYLYLAGRGTGKTRAGAEWIVSRSLQHPVDLSGAPTERLVVGEKIADIRNVLIAGPSGILRVLDRKGINYRYYKSPKPRILLRDTGVLIHGDSAENPDVGRGFNLADVLMDEICKWPFPTESWKEGIMPSLRTSIPGDHPRAFVATTPKPIRLLREWVDRTDGTVIHARGSTYDNAANLSEQILDQFHKEYDGTELGRQEISGELLDDLVGKLFSQKDLDATRLNEAPGGLRIAVGVDPGLTGGRDETGVVVVGADDDGEWYVLADRTILGVGREAAEHCWRVVDEFRAERLVVEVTIGRKWMTETFRDVWRRMVDDGDITGGTTCPIEEVDAKSGKALRAQPVGMRCEQHRLHLVGEFDDLETQMVEFDPNGRDSPDRLDAMVHGCRYHLKREKRRISISTPTDAMRRRRQRLGGQQYGFGDLYAV